MELQLIDKWDDYEERYLTIELNRNEYVTVKTSYDGEIYVMDCENGYEVFPIENDVGIRNLTDEEKREIMSFAKEQFEIEAELDRIFG